MHNECMSGAGWSWVLAPPAATRHSRSYKAALGAGRNVEGESMSLILCPWYFNVVLPMRRLSSEAHSCHSLINFRVHGNVFGSYLLQLLSTERDCNDSLKPGSDIVARRVCAGSYFSKACR